jgi:hypothetical protein
VYLLRSKGGRFVGLTTSLRFCALRARSGLKCVGVKIGDRRVLNITKELEEKFVTGRCKTETKKEIFCHSKYV